VTRKVTHQVARIKCGLADKLAMGNLEAKRDWGFAADYVYAMWLILQQPEPDDFVLATGETHSIRELLQVAFDTVGLDWKQHVECDAKLMRPAEVEYLCGDASKARQKLGWRPRLGFAELIQLMVQADLEALQLSEAAALLNHNGNGRVSAVRR
jgi:GDPmannose 4,6-dehydratase